MLTTGITYAALQPSATTPAATRFYRSVAGEAAQVVRGSVAEGARLEWVPQETLAYPACVARNEVRLRLAPGASLFATEVLGLGLPAAEQPFQAGRLLQHLEIEGQWLDRGWLDEELPQSTNVRVVAELRDHSPLVLEHRFGAGRVVTCLTSAGPLLSPQGEPWNNWANGPAAPSFAVFQLDLAKYVARSDRTLPQLAVGEPITETFSRTTYKDEVEFVTPDNQVTQVRAVERSADDAPGNAAGGPAVRSALSERSRLQLKSGVMNLSHVSPQPATASRSGSSSANRVTATPVCPFPGTYRDSGGAANRHLGRSAV